MVIESPTDCTVLQSLLSMNIDAYDGGLVIMLREASRLIFQERSRYFSAPNSEL
jgi:hypothetical protein